MGGMDSIFITPVLVRCLIGPLGLSEHMTSTSCTQTLQTVLMEAVTRLWLPTRLHHLPLPSHPPTLLYMQSVILQCF